MTRFQSSRWLLTLAVLAGLVAAAAGGPAYPLKQSANKRYLVDQKNTPFLMVGDSPQSLVVNLTDADAASYLLNRATNGFNSVLVDALCVTYTGGRSDGRTIDSTKPFTNGFDLTTPNETYFAHLDNIINMAATNGILVVLDPLETGGLLSTAISNGSNNCYIYGQYLGNRYKNFTNIVWSSGNDYNPGAGFTNDFYILTVANGIKSMDTNHLQTAELNSDTLSDSNWWAITTLNSAYTYYPTYDEVLICYGHTNFVPTFLTEAHYESEAVGSASDNTEFGTPLVLRHQEYWALTSGACGQLYGNHYTWQFIDGWQTNLNTVGVAQLGYVTALFQPRQWWNLIPDTNHVVLTAGLGSYAHGTGLVSTNDFATAAKTPDGTLAIAYVPTVRTVAINLSAFSGPVTARWYDPTKGTFVAIAGSPFPNSGSQNFTSPGKNAAGDGDWALVLEAPASSATNQPALLQQNYTAAQTSQAQVSVAYSNAQTRGGANIVAIGWFDTNAAIRAVGDSAGNFYQVAVPTFQSNNLSQAIYYSTNIAGGNNTVTVQFNQAATNAVVHAAEFSGLGPANFFDAGRSASGIGTAADSGPVATTTTNEMIFGAGITRSSFSASDNGFEQQAITIPTVGIVEETVAPTPGVYDATASLNPTSAWLMQVAAFATIALTNKAPPLRIFLTTTNTAVVAWPTNWNNYMLQQNPGLNPTNWANVASAITTVGDEFQTVVSPSSSQRFYRLKLIVGAPELRIFSTTGNTAVVAWPTLWAGFTLQENSGLNPANWVNAPNAITVVGDEFQTAVSPSAGQQFYRLKYP